MADQTLSARRRFIALLSIMAVAALAIAAPLMLPTDTPRSILLNPIVMAAGGSSYELTKPLVISQSPRIVVERGTVRLGQVGDGASSGRAVLDLILGGNATLVLQNATLDVDVSERDRTGSAAQLGAESAPLAPIVNALKSHAYSRLNVRSSTVRFTARPGATQILHIKNGTLDRSSSGPRLSGQAEYRNQPIDFDVTLKPEPTKAGQDPTFGLKAALSNTLFSTSLAGQVVLADQTRFSSQNLDLRVVDVPKLANWLEFAWPKERSVGAFAVRGALVWANGNIAFPNSKFIIDGNAATGSLSVGSKGTRTVVDGTLAFDRLDATAYLKSAPQSRGARPISWLQALSGIAHSQPVFDDLKNVYADLRISASRFKAAEFEASDIAATVTITSEQLIADIADIALDSGGHGAIQLRVNAKAPVATCEILAKLDGFKLGLASELLFGAPIFRGTGRVTARISGHGLTRETLLSSLAGKVHFSSESAVGLGADLGQLLTAAHRGLGQKPHAYATAGWESLLKGSTALDRIDARFKLGHGRVLAEHVIAKAGLNSIEGRGSFLIPDERMSLDIWVGSKAVTASGDGRMPQIRTRDPVGDGAAPSHVGGAAPGGVTGLIVVGDRIRIEGDWSNPTILVEPISATSEARNESSSNPPALPINAVPTSGARTGSIVQ